MRLYHFTTALHLPAILGAGYLKTVESNLHPVRAHAAPDVVWLTDCAEVSRASHGLDGSSADKTRVRFTLDLADAEAWRTFAERNGIARDWYRALDASGGFTARHWWVIARPVLRSEWREVRDMKTGAILSA